MKSLSSFIMENKHDYYDLFKAFKEIVDKDIAYDFACDVFDRYGDYDKDPDEDDPYTSLDDFYNEICYNSEDMIYSFEEDIENLLSGDEIKSIYNKVK